MRVMGSEQDFISVWEVVSGSAEVLGCCAVWGQGSTHCGGAVGDQALLSPRALLPSAHVSASKCLPTGQEFQSDRLSFQKCTSS